MKDPVCLENQSLVLAIFADDLSSSLLDFSEEFLISGRLTSLRPVF